MKSFSLRTAYPLFTISLSPQPFSRVKVFLRPKATPEPVLFQSFTSDSVDCISKDQNDACTGTDFETAKIPFSNISIPNLGESKVNSRRNKGFPLSPVKRRTGEWTKKAKYMRKSCSKWTKGSDVNVQDLLEKCEKRQQIVKCVRINTEYRSKNSLAKFREPDRFRRRKVISASTGSFWDNRDLTMVGRGMNTGEGRKREKQKQLAELT